MNIYHKTKKVGELNEGIFRKIVKGSKHKLRKLNAWGISKSVIQQLVEKRCSEIRIKDSENNIVYFVDLDKFIENAIPMQYDDMQLFLPLDKWQTT